MTNKNNFLNEDRNIVYIFIIIFGKPVSKYVALFQLHCLPTWKKAKKVEIKANCNGFACFLHE